MNPFYEDSLSIRKPIYYLPGDDIPKT